MSTQTPQWSKRARLTALVIIAIASCAALFIPITTWLGVKVIATGDQRGKEVWDKVGRNQIWEIWWRARHLDGDYNETLLLIGLSVLLIAFISFAVLALWYALSLPAPDEASAGE